MSGFYESETCLTQTYEGLWDNAKQTDTAAYIQ